MSFLDLNVTEEIIDKVTGTDVEWNYSYENEHEHEYMLDRNLEIMQEIEDPEYGKIVTPSLPFMMSGSKVEVKCPKYTGGDNDEIFKDVLGLSDEEYNKLYEEHVI